MSYTRKTTALCRKCGGETKQIVRGGRSMSLSASFTEPPAAGAPTRAYQTELSYELYECTECQYIDLRPSSNVAASGITVTFHPQRSPRPMVPWRKDLPAVFVLILEEVYMALNTECRLLAILGARAVVDLLLRDQVGDVVSFRGKLKALEEAGLLGANARELLGNVLGGNGAEELAQPATLETLNRVMDAVEDLLHATYIRRIDASPPARSEPRRTSEVPRRELGNVLRDRA